MARGLGSGGNFETAESSDGDGPCDGTRILGILTNPRCHDVAQVAAPLALGRPGEVGFGKRKRELDNRERTVGGQRLAICGSAHCALARFARSPVVTFSRSVLVASLITSHNVRATNDGGAGREERTLPRMRFTSDATSAGNTTAPIVPMLREAASRSSRSERYRVRR